MDNAGSTKFGFPKFKHYDQALRCVFYTFTDMHFIVSEPMGWDSIGWKGRRVENPNFDRVPWILNIL